MTTTKYHRTPSQLYRSRRTQTPQSDTPGYYSFSDDDNDEIRPVRPVPILKFSQKSQTDSYVEQQPFTPPSQDPLNELMTCLYSGNSSQINYSYNNKTSSHTYEDSCFRVTLGDISFYGVLDGHDGSAVTLFARDTLINEISTLVNTDMQPKEILNTAILNVDQNLHERIRPLVQERATIKIKIAGTKNCYEAYQAYPDEINRLGDIEEQIKGGTTAVVAIIRDNNLYVANVGDSRAVLVTLNNTATSDGNVEFQIDQLTEDHTTANDNELDRLESLGLDKQQIQGTRRVGSMETTRSIGDFGVKWGYKDFDILSNASGPPVISKPFVSDPIPIKPSFYFMFLMSDGVYHAVEEMSDCSSIDASGPDPNIRIAHLLHQQLKAHKNCQKAAENVLEEICRTHMESWEKGCCNCCRRDDMTLLVRLFNNPNKLYGHKRNHSGTIFRSSFSFTSTSSGETVTPQAINDSSLVDMLSRIEMSGSATQTSTPKPVPVLRTNDGTSSPYINSETFSPTMFQQQVFDPEGTEPYIKFGEDFPNDLVLSWIKEEFNLN